MQNRIFAERLNDSRRDLIHARTSLSGAMPGHRTPHHSDKCRVRLLRRRHRRQHGNWPPAVRDSHHLLVAIHLLDSERDHPAGAPTPRRLGHRPPWGPWHRQDPRAGLLTDGAAADRRCSGAASNIVQFPIRGRRHHRDGRTEFRFWSVQREGFTHTSMTCSSQHRVERRTSQSSPRGVSSP